MTRDVVMRVLKGLGWFVAFALMLLVLAFAWGRLRGPNERQARAMALFDQDMKPTKGRNAFPALWMSDYDVPSDQVDAVYQQNRPREEKLIAEYLAKPDIIPDPTVGLEAKYPKLPQIAADERKIVCRTREEDCLTKVRAHREEISALLTRQSIRLKHDIAFAETDYEWNDLPQTVFAIPPYGSTQNFWLTSAALDFVDGRTAQGLNDVCTNALTMRRLHTRNNTLVGTMIAAARLEGTASLFTHMLSELSPEQNLPESCTQAFAQPRLADVDFSRSMQWEFLAATGIYKNQTSTKKAAADWLGELTFSRIGTERQQAAQFAWICSNDVNEKILGDSPFTVQDLPRQADIFDWVSNASGNILILIPQPAYADYLNRQEDAAATLRLVATILWLRQTHGNGKTLSDRFSSDRRGCIWLKIVISIYPKTIATCTWATTVLARPVSRNGHCQWACSQAQLHQPNALPIMVQ